MNERSKMPLFAAHQGGCLSPWHNDTFPDYLPLFLPLFHRLRFLSCFDHLRWRGWFKDKGQIICNQCGNCRAIEFVIANALDVPSPRGRECSFISRWQTASLSPTHRPMPFAHSSPQAPRRSDEGDAIAPRWLPSSSDGYCSGSYRFPPG